MEGLNTPRANTLKCSITLSAPGLSNERITNAITAIDDESSMDNEIRFMTLVALNNTDSADQVPFVCNNTDSPGLEFLANAARVGTQFASFIPGLDLADVDEEILEAADFTLIHSDCSASTSCQTVLGEAAESMFSSFCIDADLTENEICADVDSAISNNSTPVDIGIALIGLFTP